MKAYKHLLIISLFSAYSVKSYSQDSKPKEEKNFAIKIMPLSILDFISNHNFTMAGEAALSEKISVQLSGSYYWQQQTITATKNIDYGYMFRPELRFYLGENSQRLSGLYLAPQGMFKFIQYKSTTTNISNDPMQPNLQTVRNEKHVYGGHFIIGYQLVSNGGFVFDMYGGPGYRNITYYQENASGSRTVYTRDNITSGGIISGALGFRLGFAF